MKSDAAGPGSADEAMHRVLVAICLAAEEDGLVCTASDARLASSSGLPPGVVSAALAALGRDGRVGVLVRPGPDGIAVRRIVLMDHEAAGWYVAETLRAGGDVRPDP